MRAFYVLIIALGLTSCSQKAPDMVLGVGLTYASGKLVDAEIVGSAPDMVKCRALAAQAMKANSLPAGSPLTVKLGCAAVELQ
jgi:hypothetical protein